jgi:hypothetical protein
MKLSHVTAALLLVTLGGISLQAASQSPSAQPVEDSDSAVIDHSEDAEIDAGNLFKRSPLHEQNAILVGQNQLLQQQLDVLTANYDSLAASRDNQFFLYGGLLVFLGACLSALVPRLRGRKKLGEWG